MNDVQIFDNVFGDDDRKKIIEKVDLLSWKFGHAGKYGTHRKFWFSELIEDPFFSKNLFEKMQYLVGAQCKLRRVFANGQTYGQDGDWHTDSADKDQYTFVYYANDDWKKEWEGETSFIVDDKVISVFPKNNKGIFFPSSVTHIGKAPSRECYKLRVTIAFHFGVVNWLK